MSRVSIPLGSLDHAQPSWRRIICSLMKFRAYFYTLLLRSRDRHYVAVMVLECGTKVSIKTPLVFGIGQDGRPGFQVELVQ